MMRLQSAIFSIEDTILDPAALPEYRTREGLNQVLSLLKMESVWLYAVTAMERSEANAALERCGLTEHFRGVLTAQEAGCAATDGKIFEKAMRRLRSEQRDTVVFAGRLDALRGAKEAGFRAAAVAGCAGGKEWEDMKREADEIVESYRDFLA